MSTLDQRALRDAFGAFITGVTVVTTLSDDGTPIGFTANSFTSVSLDPPLLLVCISKSSNNIQAFVSAARFAVNILSEDQREVSQTFATQVDDRFAAVSWRRGPYGSPVFENVCAWFDCAAHQTVDAGDHIVLIGRVEAFQNVASNGLGYMRGSYFTPANEERAVAAAASDGAVEVGAVVARAGKVLLLPDASGGLRIPSLAMDTRIREGSHLARLLGSLGLPAAPGLIYSVYHDRTSGTRWIVYRCSAGAGEPGDGAFHTLDSDTLARVASRPEKNMLQRFSAESRVGNFGVYFGHERGGEVRRSGRETES